MWKILPEDGPLEGPFEMARSGKTPHDENEDEDEDEEMNDERILSRNFQILERSF